MLRDFSCCGPYAPADTLDRGGAGQTQPVLTGPSSYLARRGQAAEPSQDVTGRLPAPAVATQVPGLAMGRPVC